MASNSSSSPAVSSTAAYQRPSSPTKTDSPNTSSRVRLDKQKLAKTRPVFSPDDQFVTLLVGKDKKRFVVHKPFACHYSPILEAAFNGPFLEGQTQTYCLAEDTEDTIALFVQWIYSQQLETQIDGDDDILIAFAQSLVRLWVLAVKLLVPGLQDASIKLLESTHRISKQVPISMVSFVYENAAPGSKLRQWLVHICARHLSAHSYSKFQENFSKEMLVELVTTFRKANKMAPRNPVKERDISEFCIDQQE